MAAERIEDMAVSALRRLRGRIEARITEMKSEERQEAFLKLEECAAELGLTVSDLRLHYGNAGNATSDADVKYRNPETGETWCGRGRRPNWVKEELATGRKLEDLAV